MKSKKLITGAAVILVAAGTIFMVLRGREKPVEYEARPIVSTEQPGKNSIILYTDLTGTIEPQSRAGVQPKIAGEVLEVYFQAGDQVEAGQALCKIDSDVLTSLKLQMDAASVSANEAARELARVEPLYAGGYISQQAIDQARDAAKSARLAYESAKNQYDLQLEYTTVTAPINGVVEARNVEPHDHVSPDTEICAISGSDQLQVKFGITEKTLKNLAVTDTIEITKNGSDYQGIVTEIGSMVNPTTGLYDVKAAIHQADGLTTGAKVKLSVVMDRTENAMTVPVDAVNYDNGAPFVYCYQDGIAHKTMIESGIYDSEKMEVKSGLEQDSQIITSWSNELMDGSGVLLDTEQP